MQVGITLLNVMKIQTFSNFRKQLCDCGMFIWASAGYVWGKRTLLLRVIAVEIFQNVQ